MAENIPNVGEETVVVDEETRMVANVGVSEQRRMEVDEGRQGLNQQRWENMIEEDNRAIRDLVEEQERFPSLLRSQRGGQQRGEHSERAKGQQKNKGEPKKQDGKESRGRQNLRIDDLRGRYIRNQGRQWRLGLRYLGKRPLAENQDLGS